MCKQNVTRFPYEIVRLAEDIAGGLVVTMPSQKDFHSDTVVGRNGETIGEICNKFFATREGVSTEDQMCIRDRAKLTWNTLKCKRPPFF